MDDLKMSALPPMGQAPPDLLNLVCGTGVGALVGFPGFSNPDQILLLLQLLLFSITSLAGVCGGPCNPSYGEARVWDAFLMC